MILKNYTVGPKGGFLDSPPGSEKTNKTKQTNKQKTTSKQTNKKQQTNKQTKNNALIGTFFMEITTWMVKNWELYTKKMTLECSSQISASIQILKAA